ncbi:MAG: TonB-dependent receptor [Bacteroidales bacterium]
MYIRARFLFSLISLLCIFHDQALAQDGTITGLVRDASTGELLPGVTIFAEGTSSGTITDGKGYFSLPMEAGRYDLRISFISYETIHLKNIEVKPHGTTEPDIPGLKTANIRIEEVVIKSNSIRNTENALIALKKRAVGLMDGVSSSGLQAAGDTDAASSIRRVSGVSLTSGKYVFVRGLGDRYTKTILNGMDIPGLDPDRNTIQMDIFPTNIIDNIIIHKSFSADLPADFTGGVIDIEIRDFPVNQKGNISVSTGYNPEFHFNSQYLKYDGGKTDFLGFDDGTRKVPASSDIPEFAYALADPDGTTGQQYKSVLDAFNPQMAAMQQKSFMDYGFGATYGNQVEKRRATVGYNFALSYKNNTEFYSDAVDANYGMNANPGVLELDQRESKTGAYGVNNVVLGGLAGYSWKTNYTKIRTYLMHLQNGKSQAGMFDFEGSDQGSEFMAKQHLLDYSQRSLSNILLDGHHRFSDAQWDLVWKVSPTLSVLYDPDVRFTRYKDERGRTEIGTEVGFPERIWRNLFEMNIASTVHATRNFTFMDRKSNLKFGGAYTRKYREYSIQTFKLNVRGGDTGNLPLTGDPDELLSEELKWPYQGNVNFGTTFENDLNPANKYSADVNYGAVYVSADIAVLRKLRLISGIRLEKYSQRYTGQNQGGSKILDNDLVLDGIDLFPSMNLIFNLTDQQILRVSFSRTIARPSLKELSYAEIYDPLTGKTFIGGLHPDQDPINGTNYWDGKMKSTYINNFDLRYEYFLSPGALISLSGFYKKFNDPIEVVQFAIQTGAFQPRNVGDGEVFGGEFEIRQKFGFISESFENISFNTNITRLESRIKLSNTEFESSVYNARENQVIDQYRPMAGQAPYIINSGISFDGSKRGLLRTLEAGLYYNVQGPTLQFVGIADRPNIFSLPFHSLNFNASMKMAADDRLSLGLKVSNILGSDRQMVYRSFGAAEQLFEFRNPGTSFSMNITYSFF